MYQSFGFDVLGFWVFGRRRGGIYLDPPSLMMHIMKPRILLP